MNEIKFTFEDGTFCFIDIEKFTLGNGYAVDAYVRSEEYTDHFEKVEGYLMLDEGNTYLDICKTLYDENGSEVECPVLYTLDKLCGVSYEGEYNATFVSEYHPDYNCDMIAWLDDAYCAMDNETENDAHWIFLGADIVKETWEEQYCRAIYESRVYRLGASAEEIERQLEKDSFSSIGDFGSYLADKYKTEIESEIARLEGEIMEDALKDFARILRGE